MTRLPETYLEQILGTLRENLAFCQSDDTGLEAWTETVELLNDAIDALRFWTPLQTRIESFSKFAMLNYLFTIQLPLSYGIQLDFLAGNLPACFMQLRSLVEHLAGAYQADKLFPQFEFFQDRLKRVERRRIGATIGSVDRRLLGLWRKLSNRWVHMRALEPIVEATIERGIPGYALVIPLPYGPAEVPDLEELRWSLGEFREVLGATIEKWKSEFFDV